MYAVNTYSVNYQRIMLFDGVGSSWVYAPTERFCIGARDNIFALEARSGLFVESRTSEISLDAREQIMVASRSPKTC